MITPADSYTLDSRPMEGMTYLEHPAPAVYLDSWLMKGVSYPRPHVDWEVLNEQAYIESCGDCSRLWLPMQAMM